MSPCPLRAAVVVHDRGPSDVLGFVGLIEFALVQSRSYKLTQQPPHIFHV